MLRIFRKSSHKVPARPVSTVRRVGSSRNSPQQSYVEGVSDIDAEDNEVAENENEDFNTHDSSNSIETSAFSKYLTDNEWRGVLEILTSEVVKNKCVVADMQFNAVRILSTKEHASSGAYVNMVNKIKQENITIESEEIGTEAQIRAVYRMNDSISRSRHTKDKTAEERRNVQLYEDLMAGGYRLGASDAHLEIDPHEAVVRLRINGRLRKWKVFQKKTLEDAVGAAYGSLTKAGTNSGGSFSLERAMSTVTTNKVNGVTIDGRFSSHPTYDGSDIVIRLIINDPKKVTIRSLKALGYSESHIAAILDALKRNSGLITIAGSTGSGKSTSLVTLLDIIPGKEELKIVAVEDPVEYRQPGVRKISIQRGPDDPEETVRRKFNATLRQQMRMDPDVLEIGEIRDKESGAIAAEFVMTGHRVLTTIHGDSCFDVLARACGKLISIPEEVLAMRRFLAISMYQKLLPVLCSCKKPAESVLDELTLKTLRTKFKLDTTKMHCANEDGCEKCIEPSFLDNKGNGVIGQTVAAEVLEPTNAIRECISRRDWAGVERLWRESRRTEFDDPDMTGKTAFEHALFKVSQGIVDIRDVIREFENLDTYEIFPMLGASQDNSNPQPIRAAA